jgi:hypothetical protein
MKSKKATRALEDKLSQLILAFDDLVKQMEEIEKQMQRWPVEEILVHGQKCKVRRIVSEYVDRAYSDSYRELGRIKAEIRATELVLHPPMGRGEEPIYQQAQLDRASNPQLTVRLLAEKYLPQYFPNRADFATRMMDQGLRRLTRKQVSHTKKK